MKLEQVEIRNPRLDYVDQDSHSGASHGMKRIKRRMFRGPWDHQKAPSCVRLLPFVSCRAYLTGRWQPGRIRR